MGGHGSVISTFFGVLIISVLAAGARRSARTSRPSESSPAP
jgi:ribose/xylose/arabinose/galactoside ABC-type transport system permease subunit